MRADQTVTAKVSFYVAHDGAKESGGERGIRTLDTLPYTHFQGVRLRPLGQLSVARSLP